MTLQEFMALSDRAFARDQFMERIAANTPTILANVYYKKPHSAGFTIADFMDISRARGRLGDFKTRQQNAATPMRIAKPGERPPQGLGVRGK